MCRKILFLLVNSEFSTGVLAWNLPFDTNNTLIQYLLSSSAFIFFIPSILICFKVWKGKSWVTLQTVTRVLPRGFKWKQRWVAQTQLILHHSPKSSPNYLHGRGFCWENGFLWKWVRLENITIISVYCKIITFHCSERRF